MSRSGWAWGRSMGCVLTFVVLVWHLGTGPFLDGLRTINGAALAAAAGFAVVTTVCCAWRWKIVAAGLGVDLSLSDAVAAYYRSLFLNVTLPGGIVGDVHRGVSQGRKASDVGRGLRSVAWERFAGQVVQLVLTVAVLLALPSPARSVMPVVVIVVAASGLGVILASRIGGPSAWTRLRRTVMGEIHDALLARRAWPGITLASALVLGGHTATFLLAARTAGTTAPLLQMVPVALIVLAAGVLPSVGGWGPREGVTAWIFGAAGLHAQRGVATAVVYGVMVFVASLPGASIVVVAWFRGSRAQPPLREMSVHA